MTEGFTRGGFNADLDLGHAHENTLADLLIRSLGSWVEVKFDEKCQSTGNLFVEVNQPDRRTGLLKPSGLSTSTADYWAFEFEQSCWLIVPRLKLERIVAETRVERGTKMGGDFNSFEGVLVPIERLVLPEVLWTRVRRAA